MIDVLITIGGLVGFYLLFEIFQKPLWGVALVIVVNPLESFFPSVVGGSVGRMLGVLTTLIWLIHLSRNRVAMKNLFTSVLLRKQSIFLISVLLSGLVAYFEIEGYKAMNSAFTILLLGVFALMLENLIVSKSDLRLISVALAISGALSCVPAIMYFIGFDIYTPLGVEAPMDISEEKLRATTLGGNANALGIVARNGIFACILLMTLVRKKSAVLMTWTLLLICITGIVLSGSRTNFYGTIVIFIVVLTLGMSKYIFKDKRSIILILGFIGISLLAFQLVPEPVQNRLFMGGEDERIANRSAGRYDFTKNQQRQSIEFITEHPLLGVGLNRTFNESKNNYAAHDTVSVIIGETGLLGIFGFILLFYWAVKRLYILRKFSVELNEKLRAALLLGALLSMLVMGALGGSIIPYDRTFWMTLALIYPITQMTIHRSKATPIAIKRCLKNKLKIDHFTNII